MSLHAHLSPEAEARLEAQKRASMLSSVFVSLLAVTLVLLILFFILLPAIDLSTPSIVTYNAGVEDEEQLEERRVSTKVQQQPSARSSSMAKVIASSLPSPTAIPVPEMDTPNPSTEFGSGDDFGEGWGSGEGSGGFAGIPATMRKRCSKGDRLDRLTRNGGTKECEDAVIKALDWFQSTQKKDGSWGGGHRVGMTGIALLAYLGHCETPLSEKYGETVQNAIVYLVGVAMANKGKLADNLGDKHWPYEHGIATYAIAEAYTFCKQLGINIPNLPEAVQTTGQWIIDNQSRTGSWDYGYAEAGRPSGGDNSIGCWQLQALKACNHTGIEYRNMKRCVRGALRFIEACQNSAGGIGYAGQASLTNVSSLAGAGALVYQMWGNNAHSVPRKACRYVSSAVRFQWDSADSDLYALYYNAQAMINYGGKRWEAFNAMFLPEVLAAQNADGSFKDVATKAGGKINAVAPEFRGGGDVSVHYRTCLAALTLEVYYRFLPGTGGKN